MEDQAQEIFEYFPISKSQPEAVYIEHLWQAFLAIDRGDEAGRPFALMPFHLLFMYALQCKVLRIAKHMSPAYDIAFTMESLRDDQKILLSPTSAFEIALLSETKIIDLLKLANLNIDKCREIKALVKNRNDNLAHAKGGIEPSPEARIEQYLSALRFLQSFFQEVNDDIAKEWESDFSIEDDRGLYVQNKLVGSYICLADFKAGALGSKWQIFE